MGNESSRIHSDVGNIPPDFPYDIPFFHIENFGNVCFCNSVLQAFLFSTNISVFFSYLIDIEFPKEFLDTPFYNYLQIFAKKNEFLQKIQYHSIADMNNQKPKIPRDYQIDPSKFLESIYHETNQFIRYHHNDSHEFLIYLISSFDDTILKLQKYYSDDEKNKQLTNKETNIEGNINNQDNQNSVNEHQENIKKIKNITLFSKLFEGKRSSGFECAHCHNYQEKIEAFTYFYIGIPLDKSELDLQTLIYLSLDPDKIRTDGGWVCHNCNQKGANVDIYSYIKDPPVILIIQLQRFKVNKKTQLMEKINKCVKIQNIITLNGGDGPQKYELKSIICHIGSSLHKGHFIALNHVTNKKIKVANQPNENLAQKEDYWIYSSDTEISICKQADVDNLIRGSERNGGITPYVMLYEISH